MTVLTRYLMREIIKHFCTVLGLVVVIYLAVDFFEKIDSFLEASVPATKAICFFLFKIPLVVSQMLPISLLLSILVTFGLMSKRNELIALKSSGVSIFHLFKSVAVLGIVSAGLLLLLSEIVVPVSTARANNIWRQDVKGGATLTIRDNIWIKGNHAFYKISQYDPDRQVMYGFTAYYLDDRFLFSRRLDAKRAAFEGDRWVLQDLLVQEFDPETGVPEVSFFNQRAMAIELQPDDLMQVTKKTEEMNANDLRAAIRKIEAEGDDATRYRVDLQHKIAFPVVCVVMCLIGTAVAVRGKLKEGLPIIVAYGIVIAFLYYTVLSFFISIGYGGVLPPVVAAWTAHAIFLCMGAVALISAQS